MTQLLLCFWEYFWTVTFVKSKCKILVGNFKFFYSFSLNELENVMNGEKKHGLVGPPPLWGISYYRGTTKQKRNRRMECSHRVRLLHYAIFHCITTYSNIKEMFCIIISELTVVLWRFAGQGHFTVWI